MVEALQQQMQILSQQLQAVTSRYDEMAARAQSLQAASTPAAAEQRRTGDLQMANHECMQWRIVLHDQHRKKQGCAIRRK